MRRLLVFIVSFITWCLLAWPFGDEMPYQSLVVGAGAALIVALVFPRTLVGAPGKFLDPRRWFFGLVYLPVLFYYIIRANLQVVYIVLHPAMPIKPGIVRVKTDLKTDAGRTALANSITLTPGTFTIDITDEGRLYVHWLKVEAEDEAGATQQIVKRFEPFLKRIFE